MNTLGSLHMFMSPMTKGEFVESLNDMVGAEPSDDILRRVLEFIRMALEESAAQREERLAHEAKLREEADWEQVVWGLFDKWDNDCSGYIDAFELSTLYRLWKKSSEEDAAAFSQEALAFVGQEPDGLLSPVDFSRSGVHRCGSCCSFNAGSSRSY